MTNQEKRELTSLVKHYIKRGYSYKRIKKNLLRLGFKGSTIRDYYKTFYIPGYCIGETK